MFCDGSQSCQSSTIREIELIRASGDNALSDSTIVTQTQGTFKLYVNGTNSSPLYVYCNETDICKIDCQSSNACTTMYLYCFGTCFVDCDESNGIDCPFSGFYSRWTTNSPTIIPTAIPSNNPSYIPSNNPSFIPSNNPSDQLQPSGEPSSFETSIWTTEIQTGIPDTTVSDMNANSTLETTDSDDSNGSSSSGSSTNNSDIGTNTVILVVTVCVTLILLFILFIFMKQQQAKQQHKREIELSQLQNSKLAKNSNDNSQPMNMANTLQSTNAPKSTMISEKQSKEGRYGNRISPNLTNMILPNQPHAQTSNLITGEDLSESMDMYIDDLFTNCAHDDVNENEINGNANNDGGLVMNGAAEGAGNGGNNWVTGVNADGGQSAINFSKLDDEYQYWTRKEVLKWLKVNLMKNGFDERVTKSFLKEWSQKYITGAMLSSFNNDEKMIDSLMTQFSTKHQAFGIWMVIKACIVNVGGNEIDFQE